jgi:hypothetical protein
MEGGGEGGSAGTSAGGASAGGGRGGGNIGVAGAGVAGAAGVPGAAGEPGRGGSSGVAGSGVAGGAAGSAGGSSGGAGAGGSTGAAGAIIITGTGGVAGGGAAGRGGSGAAGRGGASGGAGGAATCAAGTPLTGGKQYCSNSKGNVSGGNYAYELWAEGMGSGCMTVYGVGAAFKANWTNVEDFLARVGLNFDQTKTPSQIGTLSADFAETKTGGTNGLVYVGIYGWTVDPLREYYILDDWGATMPGGTASDGTPRDHVGTITVDGETYEVWKKTRVNKPSIIGDATFDQYFSIRQKARQCGHVSISQHFSEWSRLGLPLGKLYEAKLLVEAQDSTGTIDFTKVTFTVGK